jgi:hypothetical protein
MPRPRSPQGKNENVCVRVSETLLAEIDAARGARSRSDWGRDAFLAALGHDPAPLGIKIVTDERMPPGTAALVSRGRDSVSVSAFTLGADEPEPERAVRSRAKPGCKHRLPPGTTYCKTCDRPK